MPLNMIKTKSDLHRYLAMDRFALGRKRKLPKIFGDYVYKYQIALRYHEYYHNIGGGIVNKIKLHWWSHIHYILGVLLGFDIPINTFDAGLRINHYGMIVVNSCARIGKYCDIHQGC